ncbi:MAG: polyamine transporter ATPase [Spirosoma sp.]|nr:polyamine transporter ATPase [Spirosoma sp.]
MLTATHLYKSFDDVTAVRNVSFTLLPGQLMGLVGASGSGKSTLLNMLAGLADVNTGVVRLNGERVPGPADVLVAGHPQIRLVHQDYLLMPNVSIRENIMYALRFFEKTYSNARVDELLKRCRLTDVQHRLPRQVSGGEKQRTAIARAVADRPAVLLLDEPFSHLDLPNRLIMRDLLFELIQHDKAGPRFTDTPPTACLFVTHEATDALSITDTLGILRDGRLVQFGSPSEVYHQPATAYTARLTGSVNIIRAKHLPALGLPAPAQPEMLICLRPEQIQLDDAGVKGTVKAVFFKGSHYEVEIELSRYVCLRLLTSRNDLQNGQQVGIRVMAESLWPLKD